MGHREVGLVTICERPVRASLIFIAIIANLFGFDLVAVITTLWLFMQTFALLQIVLNFYKNIVN